MNSHSCFYCFKTLSSKQSLKQHLNVHSGDRPFICSYPNCRVSFRHASQLSNHKKIHSSQTQKNRFDFSDFSAFIHLVILALDSKTTEIPVYQAKHLVKITLPKIVYNPSQVKLPLLPELTD